MKSLLDFLDFSCYIVLELLLQAGYFKLMMLDFMIRTMINMLVLKMSF